MNCLMPLSTSVFPLYIHEAIVMRPGENPPIAEVWATVLAQVTTLPQAGGAANNGRPTLHLLHAHRISPPTNQSEILTKEDSWINRLINHMPGREIKPADQEAVNVDIGIDGSLPETMWVTIRYSLRDVGATAIVPKPEQTSEKTDNAYYSCWPPEGGRRPPSQTL